MDDFQYTNSVKYYEQIKIYGLGKTYIVLKACIDVMYIL